MIYAIMKFKNYLLANKFVFFMDHQALLYLVNKPWNMGQIVRWFLILLEFDFLVIDWPRRTHQRTDHLSCIMIGEAPLGINDDLPNSTLFKVEIVPKWAKSFLEVLTTHFVDPKGFTFKFLATLALCRPYVLISRRLYRHKSNGFQRLCFNPKDYERVMKMLILVWVDFMWVVNRPLDAS